MRVLVTSGSTVEVLDNNRIMMTRNSGRIGQQIVSDLGIMKEGNPASIERIHYMTSRYGENPLGELPIIGNIIESTSDLLTNLEGLVPRMDIIIHSMSVCDYGFIPLDEGTPTVDSLEEYAQYLTSRLQVNPRVISKFKSWNPHVFLVGFKYEEGGTKEELIGNGSKLIEDDGCDLVVVVNKGALSSAGTIFYIIHPSLGVSEYSNLSSLSKSLISKLPL